MNIKRKVIFVVLIAFIFSFIPAFSVKALALDDINIISDTNITVETAKNWAKSKGATDTFISLADLYYKYYKDHGNVNPAVAYVQAANETGYGHFGGVIDESYYNPCGMKKSSGSTTGDDDYDADAHMRFNSWDEGVQAQLDHLALYAGAEGYPRTDTYDPRHFGSIFGKSPTVRGLSGLWASSHTYGDDLMRLYNELLSMQPVVQPPIDNIQNNSEEVAYSIDSAKYYSNNRLQLTGWILCGQDIQKVDFYMDGVLKTSFTPDRQREDVYNAYPNFNQHTSGFNIVADINGVSDGDKSIKFTITTTSGKHIEKTGTFTVGRKSNFLVAVDPGHCNGTDGGASATVNGVNYSETELNLEIGLKLRERLEAYGYRTVITRENNDPISNSEAGSLQHRVDVANNANADLFISIHQNVFNGTVSGTEGYYYENNEKAKQLAAEISKNVSQILGNNDRGPKIDSASQHSGGLYVIRNTNMSAVLIECGFIDSENDATKIANAEYQYKIADAIVNAVITVYGKPEICENGEPDSVSPVKENQDPGNDGQTSNPGDSGQASNPGDSGQGSNPGDSGQGSNPGDGEQGSNPGDGEQGSNPGDGEQGSNSGDSGQDSNQGGQPQNPSGTYDNSQILIMITLLGISMILLSKLKKAN